MDAVATPSDMKSLLFRAGVALLGLWACGLCVRISMTEQTKRADEADALELYETNAATSVTGEFRSSLATFLWAKTDEYIHGGVQLRPMTDYEKQNGADRATSGDKIILHEGYETGVLPSKDKDPRGFWGSIEREVKPYFDVRGHKHRNPAETLPLYRFMTWADPKFIPGYYVGAQVIASTRGPKKAIVFLEEGIRYNPQNLALNTEAARYILLAKTDKERAELHLLTAINGASDRELSESEGPVLQDAYRWLVLLYRSEGNKQKEIEWARRGIALFPTDPVCRHSLNKH